MVLFIAPNAEITLIRQEGATSVRPVTSEARRRAAAHSLAARTRGLARHHTVQLCMEPDSSAKQTRLEEHDRRTGENGKEERIARHVACA